MGRDECARPQRAYFSTCRTWVKCFAGEGLPSPVKSESLTAQAISKLSNVARSDVYRVLSELQEAELVEVIISKPEEFRALSVEKCVSILMQKRIAKTAELEGKTLKLSQDFKRDRVAEASFQKSQFELLAKKEGLFARGERVIGNTRECICICSPRKRMIAWVSRNLSLFQEALARRVTCRLIVSEIDTDRDFGEEFRVLQRDPNFEVRVVGGSPKAIFAIYDRREVIVGTSGEDVPYKYPALWSNNKNLVDLSQDHFECLWKRAEKPDTFKP